MTNFIIDAAKEKIILNIIIDDNLYSNEYSYNRKNFDSLGLIIFKFLDKNKVEVNEISNIFIKQGPGKLTSIRSVTAICKAIRLSNNINLYGFNADHIGQNDYKKLLNFLESETLRKNLIKL